MAVTSMRATFNKLSIFAFAVYSSKSSSTYAIKKFYLHFKLHVITFKLHIKLLTCYTYGMGVFNIYIYKRSNIWGYLGQFGSKFPNF